MLKFTLAASALLCTTLAFTAAEAATAPSRSDVASSLSAACGASEADCIAAVQKFIALELSLEPPGGCYGDCLNVSRGVGDAVISVSQSDVDLATLMAEEIAKSASDCFQTVYALVTDGSTGVASIGGIPSGDGVGGDGAGGDEGGGGGGGDGGSPG